MSTHADNLILITNNPLLSEINPINYVHGKTFQSFHGHLIRIERVYLSLKNTFMSTTIKHSVITLQIIHVDPIHLT